MGLFSTRQPRKFRRVSIYTDERKEKLQKLVEQVEREKGEALHTDEAYNTEKFKGTFINFTPRAQRYKEKGARVGWPLAVILIFILLFIWNFIMTGNR
ncbi:MAG: hypothetical protein J6W43_11210 [Prevotella sp.]|nr:hypothetical protein [Bacteroidaceae bacterium]MBP5800455.1 hypothetical protein [Prevotella sp.]